MFKSTHVLVYLTIVRRMEYKNALLHLFCLPGTEAVRIEQRHMLLYF